MGEIIIFKPPGYLPPEQRMAVVKEIQGELYERLERNSLTFADILRRMRKDAAEYAASKTPQRFDSNF